MRLRTSLVRTSIVIVAATASVTTGCGGADDDRIADTSTAAATDVPGATDQGDTRSTTPALEPVPLPAAFDPWVRMPAVGQTVAAAYVTFVNTSSSDIALLDVSSPIADAELHETVTDADGVMRMQPRGQGFVVPADGELVMAPGGAHVMLLGVDVLAIATAQQVELSFDFGPLGTVTVLAEVRGDLPAGAPDTSPQGSMPAGHRPGDPGDHGDHGDHHDDGDHQDHGGAGGLEVWALHDLDDELHLGVFEPGRQRAFVARFRAALLNEEVPAGFDLDGLVAVLDELDAALEAGDVSAAAALAFRAHDLAHALMPHSH